MAKKVQDPSHAGDMKEEKKEDDEIAAAKKKELERKIAAADRLLAERGATAAGNSEANAKIQTEAAKKAQEERIRQEKCEEEIAKKEAKQREEQVRAAQKEIEKLKAQLGKLKQENQKVVGKAENRAKVAESERDDCLKKYEDQMKDASKMDKGELLALKEKVAESDKVVAYLKADKEKTKNQRREVSADTDELKEANQRVKNASATTRASIETLGTQKANMEYSNKQLEEGISMYKETNKVLQGDLVNRHAQLEAEKQVIGYYQNATDQVVQLMEDKCEDTVLVEKIMEAQVTCQFKTSNGNDG